VLHLVGILFPHINDDARSKSHQIYSKKIFQERRKTKSQGMKMQGKCQREGQRTRWGQHIREAATRKEGRTWEEIEKQL